MTFASSLRKILCVSPDNTPLRVVTGSIVDDNNCRRNSQMAERNRRLSNKTNVSREAEKDRKQFTPKNIWSIG